MSRGKYRSHQLKLSRSTSLHLIDVENQCGGVVTDERCRAFWRHYEARVGVRPGDQIVVAANIYNAPSAFFALPSSTRRILTPATVDAADLALLASVDLDVVTVRHGAVVIASGDRIFTELAQQLRAAGVTVIQALTAGVGNSHTLYRACNTLIRLPGEAPVMLPAA